MGKFLIILLAVGSMLQAQFPIFIGNTAPAWTTASGATNSANARVSFMFTPNGSKTISKVRAYMNSLSGTLAAADLQLDIYASSDGKPTGASLATAAGTVTPAANTWQEWTGLSLAMTVDVPYHLVIRNLNATPASNNASFRGLQYVNHLTGGGGTVTTAFLTSTDATTYSVTANVIPAFRVEYSDGSFQGFVYSNGVTAVSSNYRVYGTRSWGGRFTTPANVSPKVSHCAFQQVRGTGTPTGVRCRIYQLNTGANTATSVGVSVDYPAATYNMSGGSGIMMLRFASPVTLSPATEYIMALESTNTGDSSSNYTTGMTFTVESTAGSLGLTAFNGTLRNVHCAGTCTTWSNWTQTDTDQPGMAIRLAANDAFAASGGSAGSSYVFVK